MGHVEQTTTFPPPHLTVGNWQQPIWFGWIESVLQDEVVITSSCQLVFLHRYPTLFYFRNLFYRKCQFNILCSLPVSIHQIRLTPGRVEAGHQTCYLLCSKYSQQIDNKLIQGKANSLELVVFFLVRSMLHTHCCSTYCMV